MLFDRVVRMRMSMIGEIELKVCLANNLFAYHKICLISQV